MSPFNSSSIQHCFINPGDLHNSLLMDLQNTVFLCPFLEHDLPLRNHLKTLLMAHYGGLPSNWPLTDYKEGFLFKTPSWLLLNEPILDSDFWEITQGLMMLPWQFKPPLHSKSNQLVGILSSETSRRPLALGLFLTSNCCHGSIARDRSIMSRRPY